MAMRINNYSSLQAAQAYSNNAAKVAVKAGEAAKFTMQAPAAVKNPATVQMPRVFNNAAVNTAVVMGANFPTNTIQNGMSAPTQNIGNGPNLGSAGTSSTVEVNASKSDSGTSRTVKVTNDDGSSVTKETNSSGTTYTHRDSRGFITSQRTQGIRGGDFNEYGEPNLGGGGGPGLEARLGRSGSGNDGAVRGPVNPRDWNFLPGFRSGIGVYNNVSQPAGQAASPQAQAKGVGQVLSLLA